MFIWFYDDKPFGVGLTEKEALDMGRAVLLENFGDFGEMMTKQPGLKLPEDVVNNLVALGHLEEYAPKSTGARGEHANRLLTSILGGQVSEPSQAAAPAASATTTTAVAAPHLQVVTDAQVTAPNGTTATQA